MVFPPVYVELWRPAARLALPVNSIVRVLAARDAAFFRNWNNLPVVLLLFLTGIRPLSSILVLK